MTDSTDGLNELVNVDQRIVHLERDLDSLKAERGSRVHKLLDAGVTRYQIAKAAGRAVSTVNRW